MKATHTASRPDPARSPAAARAIAPSVGARSDSARLAAQTHQLARWGLMPVQREDDGAPDRRADAAELEKVCVSACDELQVMLGALEGMPGLEGLADTNVAVGKLRSQIRKTAAAVAQAQADTLEPAYARLHALCVQVPQVFEAVQTRAVDVARIAHGSEQPDERDTLLALSRAAGAQVAPLREAAARRPVQPRHGAQGRQDAVHGVLDKAAVANDAVGGVGGSVVTVADMATGGLTAAQGPMTAVAGPLGGVLGGIGVVFGAIGLGLGLNAGLRGRSAEQRLAHLTGQGGAVQDAQVREIARFAQEKKRKKKLGGAISSTAAVGAIAAGTLALVAVGVSTMGIGALVLGLGMATIGLGLVIGKWIHRRNKRKAFAAKLDGIAGDMLKAARKESPPGPLRAQVADLGVAVADWNDRAAVDGQQPALAAALGQRVDSRRTLMAESLVAYLTGPPTPALFDAELVLAALHIDATKVRSIIASDGVATAVARVADKMKSW